MQYFNLPNDEYISSHIAQITNVMKIIIVMGQNGCKTNSMTAG